MPWAELAEVVTPHYRIAGTGRPKTEIELLPRLHCLQLWHNLSAPGLEDAVHDRLSIQRFLGLDPLQQRVPDETTLLHFRRLLETHGLAQRIFAKVNECLAAKGLLLKGGTIVDATILSAPSSTKNRDGKRDPEMSSTQKNGDWHFGITHIGVDAARGQMHTVKTTTASVHDSQVFTELTHGEETIIAGDSAYANQMLKANCRQAGLVYLLHDKGTRAKSLPPPPAPPQPPEVEPALQGRVPFPRDQAPVGARQRAPPRAQEKHRTPPPPLRPLQPIPGQPRPARERLSRAELCPETSNTFKSPAK